MQRSWQVVVIVLVSIFGLPSSSFSSVEQPLTADGTVLELDESNFDLAISSFDFMLVDFYAPWCGHWKRLAPELDAAAPQLAKLKKPVVLAKVNADKLTRLAKKYAVDAYPTIKIFMHGIPTDYYGPRKADLLVRYLKKFVAPDGSILDSDSSINDFVEAAGTYFPIYLGFGLDESIISKFAMKYKKKAWFSVAKDFSEDVMVSYDFDKVPALVSIHPNYNNERSTFYGPFEGQFLEEFIKQSLFPLVLPINYDALKLLKDDGRKIALTIVEDEDADQTKNLINLLKAAASANCDLVFAYVGAKQWGEFADSFWYKKTTLPKMVIWDGKDDYLTVIGSESILGNDHAAEISKFMEGYREGRTEERIIVGPSFIGFINSMIGIRTVYILVIIVGGIMLFQTLTKDDNKYRRVDTPSRDQVDQTSSSTSSQGVYLSCTIATSHLGFGGSVNPGIAAFEMEYNHWVEEQQRQIIELRKALQLHITDIELKILVESSLNHYYNLFCMKANAARADVFYLMSGVWRTSAERSFLWIGGFRPSELLNVLKPYFEPLSEQQRADINNLQQSSRQAEDALSQGMEKLHQNISHSIANDPLGSYISQMGDGMEKLEVLESFISQADHLRQQTLKRMSHILTTKQAAQGLLALGEYFHRLRVLSSLWAAQPREPV